MLRIVRKGIFETKFHIVGCYTYTPTAGGLAEGGGGIESAKLRINLLNLTQARRVQNLITSDFA